MGDKCDQETVKPLRRHWLRRLFVGIAAVLLPILGSMISVGFGQSYDWRTAPRHSTGIAPDPEAK